MNTDHNAIAASLDAAQVSELARLEDDAFWDYARHLAGVAPASVAPLTPSVLSTPSSSIPDVEAVALREKIPGLASDKPDNLSCLECMPGEHRCLLPLAALTEIVPVPRYLTFLPAMPPEMLGLTAWHGEPIAVIDLEHYLTDSPNNLDSQNTGGADTNSNAARRGMLLIIGLTVPTTSTFGLYVSGIGAIRSIPQAHMARMTSSSVDVPAWLAPSRVDMLASVHDGAIVLDVPMLLNALTRQIEMVPAHG